MNITQNHPFSEERRYFVTLTLQNTLNKPIIEFRLFHKHMEESDWLKILVAGGYDSKHPKANSLISSIKFSFSSPEICQLWSCLSSVLVVHITLDLFILRDIVIHPEKYPAYNNTRALIRDFSEVINKPLPFPTGCIYFIR